MKEMSKRGHGKINKNELFNTLEKKNLSFDKISNSIRNLCDMGYLCEEEDYYTIFQN